MNVIRTSSGTVRVTGERVVNGVNCVEAVDGSIWVPDSTPGSYRAYDSTTDTPANSAPPLSQLAVIDEEPEVMSEAEVAALLDGDDSNPAGEGNAEDAQGANAAGPEPASNEPDDGVVPKPPSGRKGKAS